jgi:predicted oxidoreductase
MAVLAWSPLAGGKLVSDPFDQRTLEVIAALDDIARRESVPRAAVALAWVMAHPARPIPIVGSQNPERIAEAARAFDVLLSRRDWYAVLAASRQAPLP